MSETPIALAAAVILYQPEEDVPANIAGYAPFADKIYVADNSDELRQAIRTQLAGTGKIVMLPAQGNKGIATALNDCCRNALADGYNWLLTMDQDSTVKDPAFFEAFREAAAHDTGIIAASYSLPPIVTNDFFVEATEVITSGNIVNLKAWKAIGGFCDKLFIDEVDHDFCARLKLGGFRILSTNKVYLHHHLGSRFTVYHPGRKQEITLTKHVPIRLYYETRNTLYLLKTYFFTNRKLAMTRFRELIIRVYQTLRFYPDRKLYVPYLRRGLTDFIIGRYGKYRE